MVFEFYPCGCRRRNFGICGVDCPGAGWVDRYQCEVPFPGVWDGLAGVCAFGDCSGVHRTVARSGAECLGDSIRDDCVRDGDWARDDRGSDSRDSLRLADNRLFVWLVWDCAAGDLLSGNQAARKGDEWLI